MKVDTAICRWTIHVIIDQQNMRTREVQLVSQLNDFCANLNRGLTEANQHTRGAAGHFTNLFCHYHFKTAMRTS